MNYKAVLSDFDDTLLPESGVVSEETIKTIKEFQEKGGFFGVCTGRMTASALKVARELGLSGYVMGYQGGTLCDIKTGELLVENRISKEQAIAVLIELEKYRKNIIQIYIGDNFYAQPNKYSEAYGKAIGIKPTIMEEKLSDFVAKNNQSLNKIMMFVHPIQQKRLIRKFSKKFPSLHFVSSKKFFLEITSNDATKGGMAKIISQRMNIPKEQMICIGDSLNDISMIKFAGIGCCVANGRKEVKKIADLVIESNDDEGVAKLIRKVINGEI